MLFHSITSLKTNAYENKKYLSVSFLEVSISLWSVLMGICCVFIRWLPVLQGIRRVSIGMPPGGAEQGLLLSLCSLL